jgi:hypothetical protein
MSKRKEEITVNQNENKKLKTKELMHYLVIDFETTGVGQDQNNNYKPYAASLMPLPCKNYPVQLAYELLDDEFNVIDAKSILIRGAKRLDPWVIKNCPHLNVDDCDRNGIDFKDVIAMLVEVVKDKKCTIVAHNMQYDWDDVVVPMTRKLHLLEDENYQKLASFKRHCTCINSKTKKSKSAYYFKKIGRWIGPKLSDLAKQCGIEYDTKMAHDAIYDVRTTSQCLAKTLAKQ